MTAKNENLYGPLAEYCRNLQVEKNVENIFRVRAEFVIPADYPGFSGHFPGKPLLPAIVQLGVVRYLAEAATRSSLLPRLWQKIKFKGMIQPLDGFVVNLQLVGNGSGYHSEFFIERREGAILTEGKVDFITG